MSLEAAHARVLPWFNISPAQLVIDIRGLPTEAEADREAWNYIASALGEAGKPPLYFAALHPFLLALYEAEL